jgi:hypothetical protein
MPLPDISSLDDVGGPKANYAPVTDPTTDEDAVDRNRYVCDVVMMGHTAPRAFVRFVAVNGANPTDPVTNVHDAMWGSSVGVKPVVARTGEGVWTVTWPETVDDELTAEDASLGGGEEHTVNIRVAIAQATPVIGGVLKHAVAEVTSANVVTVYGFLANGTADDIAGATITVVIW